MGSSAGLVVLRMTRDRWVPWLVLIGGFLVGVGWFVGVAWLWSSPTWTRNEKMLATLVLPGGVVLPLLILLFSLTTRTSDCTSSGGPGQPVVTHCVDKWATGASSGFLILLVLMVLPAIVAVNLERVRRSCDPLNPSR
jgi:hypothetical protein